MAENKSGIVLFAKQAGQTSFSSLFTVKHAFNTKKVGHTGTLDSFAQGLLVVCVGSCTRLAPYITEFDKKYRAVLEFGSETDTLDPTGNVIKTSRFPSVLEVKRAVEKFKGKIIQNPPEYSAIKVNGRKLSDLSRKGKTFEIPSREVFVFSSRILSLVDENLCECEGDSDRVKYAEIEFHVSKGTYIRSLARDIGKESNSCAHLAGLLRTKVGNFELSDAAGVQFLDEFSIKSCLEKKEINGEIEGKLEREVLKKIRKVDKNLCESCGFEAVELEEKFENSFLNGKKLSEEYFFVNGKKTLFTENKKYAVFCKDAFCGLIMLDKTKLKYLYVVQGSE